MLSKSDRLDNAINNMEEAINFYIMSIREDYCSNRINKKNYDWTTKNFSDLRYLLKTFKSRKPYENKKLDQLRSLFLSVKDYCEEQDAINVNTEFNRINNNEVFEDKEKDKKRLELFKMRYNNLSNFYKYRLTKAEKKESGGIAFKDKGIDNYKFIVEHYLTVQYRLKKVKYKPIEIPSPFKEEIAKYNKVLNSPKYDSETKDICSNSKKYLINYKGSEIVIVALEEMKSICDEKLYNNIKTYIDSLIIKYNKRLIEYKEKYEVESKKIDIDNIVKKQKKENKKFKPMEKNIPFEETTIEETEEFTGGNQMIKKLK